MRRAGLGEAEPGADAGPAAPPGAASISDLFNDRHSSDDIIMNCFDHRIVQSRIPSSSVVVRMLLAARDEVANLTDRPGGVQRHAAPSSLGMSGPQVVPALRGVHHAGLRPETSRPATDLGLHPEMRPACAGRDGGI